MEQALQIMLTVACAYAAGRLLERLRMPGGMMIGAVIGSCILSVTTGYACMPGLGKTAAQIIAGGFIGAGIKRSDLAEMKGVIRPALILLPCLLVLNIAAGYLIYLTGKMDMMTAMMSCAPGGLSDIPMIASDMGADPSIVVVLQSLRLMLGIGVFPLMIRALTGSGKEQPAEAKAKKRRTSDIKSVLLTLLVATVCGLIGKASPVPSGTMSFATIGCIAFSCVYPRAQISHGLRKGAQLLSGAYVGAGIGMAQLLRLRTLGMPALILCAGYTIACLGFGWLLTRAGCFNRAEGMLAATPAGATDMALISADLGITNAKLIVLQVLRMITVILVFPPVLEFVVYSLGG